MFRRKSNISQDLNEKSVMITGGSRGIGFVTAQAFLQRGAYLAICARNLNTLRRAERHLCSMGTVLADCVDVRKRQQIEHFVNKVHNQFGRIDILVNNAGILWVGDYAQEDFESIDEVIDVNVKGVMYMTRAVLPYMLSANQGTIINIASGAGLSGFKRLASYCTSKFAVVGFSESLHQELRDRGIRVHALCPGRVATDMQVLYAGKKVGMSPAKIAEKILQLTSPTGPAATKCIHTI